MSKNFYTSDLHFNHENLYTKGTRLPFKSAQEAQETIVKNFNAVIKPNDNLYILGDLTLNANYDDLCDFLRSLNGNKIVILGNHDKPRVLDQLKADKVIANWHYWKGCHDQGVPVFMMHFVPLEAHTGPEPRLMLHGHVHGMLKSIVKCPLLHDVGVDANNYKPFTLDHLDKDLINGIRLGSILCPYRENSSMCAICSKFVYLKANRRFLKEGELLK